MWEKFKKLVTWIYFTITPKDKSEYINYHVLTKDEFYEKQDEFIYLETIYEDFVDNITMNIRGTPSDKQFIIRKPLFICAKRESHYIRELKTLAYVGSDNYPEYKKIKENYDEALNKIESMKNDLTLQSRELKLKIEMLNFLKRELNTNVYETYERKFNELMALQRIE